MVFGILALVLCITGATFAYFTAIATSNNISGNMASVNIDLNIEKITHVDEEKGGLIPMSNNMVEIGINNNCIDNNGNAVCQIYKITTTNTGSTNLFLDGYITLTGGSGEPADYTAKNNNTTMRWAQVFCDESTNCTTVGNTTTGATGIDAFTTLDNQTDKTGLNQDNIKSNYNDVIGNGTIQDSSYDVINKNYIRVSDHDTSSTNYDRKKDVTSALVYNQQLDTTNSSSEYYFVVWLSENGQNQTQIITDKFFGGLVTFTTSSGNITGTFGNYTGVNSGNNTKLMTDYIKDLYNDGSSINTVHIGGEESKPTVSLNSSQSLMLDNNGEYRYYGANPNNYVSFNDELWRIISVSNVKSSTSDTTGKERVKLIRSESIGEYCYDKVQGGISFENSFAIKNLLNDYYYNRLDNQSCYIEREEDSRVIVDAIPCSFSDVGLSDVSKSQTSTAVWRLEQTTSPPDSPFGTYEDDQFIEWEGNIMMLSLTDYGYAQNLGVCSGNINYYGPDPEECKTNNWLFNGEGEWFSVTNHDDGYGGFALFDNGSALGGTTDASMIVLNSNNAIRPTLYLNANITITKGTGTNTDPYILSES